MKASICFVSPHAEGALRSRLGLPTELGFGGAEVQAALVGCGLASRGHEVTFVCDGPRGGPEEARVGPVRVLYLPFAPGGPRRSRTGSVAALGRALSAAGARIVYQRCALPLTGLVAWHCRRAGRRFVFAVANDRDLDGRARPQLGWSRYALYRYGLRRADRIVVQSQGQARQVPLSLRERVVEIPSALDLDGVSPRPEPPTPEVLWVANLLSKKRPFDLLDLARLLPEVRFVVVAPAATDPFLADRFLREVRALPNVERHGRVPHAEMGRFYARAACLLNTSEAEGVPNTFLEGWAREVPVFSLGVDPDGVIRRLGLGRVVSREEAPRLLLDYLRDPRERSEAGRRARDHVERSHSLPAVLDLYMESLAELF